MTKERVRAQEEEEERGRRRRERRRRESIVGGELMGENVGRRVKGEE